MQSRRDFLKAASALGTQSLFWGDISAAITRAAAIDPAPGTTFHDAEHVVILMQENRSFDHAFGALKGVRGFRDPRIHRQPDGTPVWFQPDEDGTIVPPFRVEMFASKVTWMGDTPHSWKDQVDARNNGRYNKWLPAKRRRDKFPLTMGYFTREDIPFYYAFADAFTVFDYAFCSSLTGTTANRHYLWTGTIRETPQHPARVQNGDTNYEREAAWTTYPERLQDAGVSWKIYQNEISLDTGFKGEEDSWLANFTDNNLEWFTQYGVRFHPARQAFVKRQIESLQSRLAELESSLQSTPESEKSDKQTEKNKLTAELTQAQQEAQTFSEENWQKLPERTKQIHRRAFCTNTGDPHYRQLEELRYQDGSEERSLQVPKGDILDQFRKDVKNGDLPAVTWLVPPQRFSDHPSSAWFGAWYLSEALNILTQDPEVWKKTVFILCYDENDGMFDHIPPFVAPHPNRPETGKCSAGIDTTADVSDAHDRDHSIGLGYRCPFVVASPWSRGGCVNSQITDHTSVLMFLETWLESKGTPVKETNLSDWRRTVCGNLTSAFRPYNGEKIDLPAFLDRDETIERIHKARFAKDPKPTKTLTPDEIEAYQMGDVQERGVKTTCPLPYELEADLAIQNGTLRLNLQAGNRLHGKDAAGAAFNLYTYQPDFTARAYAVAPGKQVTDEIPLPGQSHVRLDGPNGFARELTANANPAFEARLRQDGPDVALTLVNRTQSTLTVTLKDESYGQSLPAQTLAPGQSKTQKISTKQSAQWYDLTAQANQTTYRFSGKTETKTWTTTDPAMA